MASMTKIFHHASYATIDPTAPANSQIDRTILITGATTGIGFAIAKAFIQAKASRVILTGRRQAALDRARADLSSISNDTEVVSLVCDISVESSIRNLWQRLLLEDMRVDVLVLNAADASSGPMIPLQSFLPQLHDAFNTNTFNNALLATSFLEQPSDDAQTTRKAIINISTFAAHSNPSPIQAAYSTSKAAFAHLMQLLADEVSVDDCQIVNVHPGAILTQAASKAPQEVLDSVVWDRPELPAGFAVWASTREASLLHGRFVWANWDVDELLARRTEFKDPGFLKLGLQGAEFVDRTTIFSKIRGSVNS